MYERFKAQFRAEALHAFNTPIMGRPDATFGNPTFGRVTTQRNFPRLIPAPLCCRLEEHPGDVVCRPALPDARGFEMVFTASAGSSPADAVRARCLVFAGRPQGLRPRG